MYYSIQPWVIHYNTWLWVTHYNIWPEWLILTCGFAWCIIAAGHEWFIITPGFEWLLVSSSLEWHSIILGIEWLITTSGLRWLIISTVWDLCVSRSALSLCSCSCSSAFWPAAAAVLPYFLRLASRLRGTMRRSMLLACRSAGSGRHCPAPGHCSRSVSLRDLAPWSSSRSCSSAALPDAAPNLSCFLRPLLLNDSFQRLKLEWLVTFDLQCLLE